MNISGPRELTVWANIYGINYYCAMINYCGGIPENNRLPRGQSKKIKALRSRIYRRVKSIINANCLDVEVWVIKEIEEGEK